MKTKTYVGFSRDHSGSMRPLRDAALKDYNQNIATLKEQTAKNEQDTIVTTVRCGIMSGVDREIVNSNVTKLKPLDHYPTDGQTPLFDSIGELIELMEDTPDARDPNIAFLIMVITDGAENYSHKWRHKLKDKIQQLQQTDRWTFVFRVPRGYAGNLTALGIPAGNIMEWDQTEKDLFRSSQETAVGLSAYYGARAMGVRSTKSFYTSAANLTTKEVKAALDDISKDVTILPVSSSYHDWPVTDFVFEKLKHPLVKGCAFYQLSKPEKQIQDYKKIIIREKSTGKVYAGPAARQMLGFPQYGTISVIPGDHGQWDIFVQSTSTNRKMKQGTSLLYWPTAV